MKEFDTLQIIQDITKMFPKKLKSLYLIEFDKDIIKIGVSQNLEERINVICRQSGRTFRKCRIYPPNKNFYQIESLFKKTFFNNRINEGEFYYSQRSVAINRWNNGDSLVN